MLAGLLCHTMQAKVDLRNRERLPKLCCHLDYAKGKPIRDEVVAVCCNGRRTGKHVIGSERWICFGILTPMHANSRPVSGITNGNAGLLTYMHACMHPTDRHDWCVKPENLQTETASKDTSRPVQQHQWLKIQEHQWPNGEIIPDMPSSTPPSKNELTMSALITVLVSFPCSPRAPCTSSMSRLSALCI